MGESAACLLRSFSEHSPTSGEEKKGNSIQRALSASVSFGRFMSESLDWEKWSAFTNNRYLEEVEKYSKPGSVAEKKAYFEAHFKRRRAAALLEQKNAAAACTVSETANAEDKVKGNSTLEWGHTQRDCCAVTENSKAEEIQSSNPVVSTGQSGNYDDTSVERTLEDTKPGGTEKDMEPLVLVGSSLELTNHLGDDACSDDIVSEKEDNAYNKDDSAMRSLASGEKTPEVSSSKLLTKEGASKCPPFVKPIVPVQLKNSDKTPESNRKSTDSSNKRRSYTTSLHMSINFAPCSDATQKNVSSGLPKIENSRIIRAPAKKYKNSVLPQTSTRASVNGVFKHYSTAPSAENKRIVRSDPISEARPADEKVQPPSSNNSKSSNLFGNKARTPTVPSSFTFKSEERAVKRREFFQILEQKAKLKETGKHQMHAKPQVTKRSNDKDFRNSIALETTKGAEAPLRNITKKVPTVKPYFPKIEERAAAFKVQDSNIIRPPWRLSAKTDGSKDFTGKNSRQENLNSLSDLNTVPAPSSYEAEEVGALHFWLLPLSINN
ncbi:hypothetical protein C2S51_035207 [Perilla frutescens var. frutescens]|nr:hypothetical protein C2S51_035207 [Perilla frutescens var. frutescens]